MAENSKIEWTDHTFNPWVGCQKVSTGCANCYAEAQMTRKSRWANCWGPPETSERIRTSDAYWKKPLMWNRKAAESGVRLKVFCGSLCDVFEYNRQTAQWREDLFTLIEQTPNLDWLLLTKRPENIFNMIPRRYDLGTVLDNVWIGTSVENQETANERIPHLLSVPARVRFLSAEPLLGPIDLMRNEHTVFGEYDWDGKTMWSEDIDWLIVGGESGPKRRPMDVEWMYNLARQCAFVDMPVFIKQDNHIKPGQRGRIPDVLWNLKEFPNGKV